MQRIAFNCDISQEAIKELLKRLQGDSRQQVWVDSPGGTFEFFSTFAPMLLRQGFTSVACDVRSAAVVLFLLGRKRFALPDSVFFFHEVRVISNEGEVTICDLETAIEWQREQEDALGRELLEEELQRMRNAQNWMLEFISRQTRMPKVRFLNLMRAEATLSAREAVQYGIVHRIVPEEELFLL